MNLLNTFLILLTYLIYTIILAKKHVLQLEESDLRVKGFLTGARSKSKAWHRLDAAINTLLLLAFMLFAAMPFNLHFVAVLIAGLSLRWLVFDAAWNYFRHVSFWYRGSTGDMDSFNIPLWLFFASKFAFVILSIAFVVISE